MSDMAGYAARVAVERCGSSRDTNNEDVIWRKRRKVRSKKEELRSILRAFYDRYENSEQFVTFFSEGYKHFSRHDLSVD
jgi:hypothetical protein